MGLTLEERKALKRSGGGKLKPRAMRIPDAVEYSGLSRASLYRHARQGAIEVIKDGRSTLLVVASLDRLLDSLPRALGPSPRPAADRGAE
jgi:hypothetical protein